MTTLYDILKEVDDYIFEWENGYDGVRTGSINDSLPDTFSQFEWDYEDDINVKNYEYSTRFTFELKRDIVEEDFTVAYYTDVKVYPVEGGYNFGIYFGEMEEGSIDIDHIEVCNETDYNYFLNELKDYLKHTFEVACRNFNEDQF